MKLDKELVREILLEIESGVITKDVEDKEKRIQHLFLTAQEGYLDTGTIRSSEHEVDLTYKGHELLSSIRDDRIWDAIKWHLEQMNLTLDSVSFETIQYMAKQIVLKSMKE
ncbi:DUF2513 domain-containing protein [Alkalicoccobacillus murimartini]|uniref:DUF2513 domain-containing protein n=1 Tax=Alkalicoccobacillus murimartini TaxID=171685 RepID=A0ABT9YLX6_9BACI|nr:DUF2513 domain-containing protein [Alkalicoccobacillus murimartini]MDQ0208882.1 hypothetical protein [Alkalicoccobacillus murimartini]